MGLPDSWGARADEAARELPCDGLVPSPVRRITRVVSVDAPPEHVYRWLCQIALGPYAYDWIDNLGRRSPRRLVAGADRLEVGQRMAIFRLVAFEPGRSWTGVVDRRWHRVFGDLAVTYAAVPDAASKTRLTCRFVIPARTGPRGVPDSLLAWGDLVMARRQLLTLKRLAEGSVPAEGIFFPPDGGATGPTGFT